MRATPKLCGYLSGRVWLFVRAGAAHLSVYEIYLQSNAAKQYIAKPVLRSVLVKQCTVSEATEQLVKQQKICAFQGFLAKPKKHIKNSIKSCR